MAETKQRITCGACCTQLVDFGVTLGRTPILERVYMHLHCGELTALIGPNGAGKTTLLRAMLGELPHTGELKFLPFGDRPKPRLRIGYVPQKLEIDALSPTTVLDLFAVTLTQRPLWLGYRRELVEDARKALTMVEAADLLKAKLGQLSGGELQRVLLALALIPLPHLLLLDEPVSGVDQAGIRLFYEILSRLREEYDLSILLISHDLRAVAKVADRIVFLNHTVLCDGSPRLVFADPLVKECFGYDFSPAEIVGGPHPRTLHDRPGQEVAT